MSGYRTLYGDANLLILWLDDKINAIFSYKLITYIN